MSRARFAFSSDAICVADDCDVGFYAPRTLKMFRVERFTDHAVVGMLAHRHGTQDGKPPTSILRIVDAAWNYVEVDLSTLRVVRTTSLRPRTVVGADAAAASTSAVATELGKPPKPVISARGAGGKRAAASQAAASSPADRTAERLVDAQFFMRAPRSMEGSFAEEHDNGGLDEDVCVVLLSAEGAWEATVTSSAASLIEAGKPTILRHLFPRRTEDVVLAVSRHTGVAVLGQRGAKWLCVLDPASSRSGAPETLALTIQLNAIACHPTDAGFAVGGSRGELQVYPPSRSAAHAFSDHWHHTPLDALHYAADGATLYSGAAEGVLLQWSLSNYTFRKIGVHLGGIRAVVGNSDRPSQLLLPCADSTLATVDVLLQRVERSVEGVAWTTAKQCTGLMVLPWMGQQAVVLTGLPNTVRICDPVTMQSHYSLHIATQLETIAEPPEAGVRHVGVLGDGRTLVTYEDYGAVSLPSALRFWVFQSDLHRHQETQVVYQPHGAPVVAMCVDRVRRRVFTLCSNSVKCWVEAEVDRTDATASVLKGGERRWQCRSSIRAPSCRVRSMALSRDGSVLAVGDDVVHVYGVSSVSPGVSWPLLCQFTQDVSNEPLRELFIDADATATVTGYNASAAYGWSLSTGEVSVTTMEAPVQCACTHGGSLYCVSSIGTVKVVDLASGKTVSKSAKQAVPGTTMYLRWLREDRFAVVDEIRGFRTLSIETTRERDAMGTTLEVGTKRLAPLSATDTAASSSSTSFTTFFSASAPQRSALDNGAGTSSSSTKSFEVFAAGTRAQQWLSQVYRAAPYTAPTASAVLSAYLKEVTPDEDT